VLDALATMLVDLRLFAGGKSSSTDGKPASSRSSSFLLLPLFFALGSSATLASTAAAAAAKSAAVLAGLDGLVSLVGDEGKLDNTAAAPSSEPRERCVWILFELDAPKSVVFEDEPRNAERGASADCKAGEKGQRQSEVNVKGEQFLRFLTMNGQ
jgi:hypothetical protein